MKERFGIGGAALEICSGNSAGLLSSLCLGALRIRGLGIVRHRFRFLVLQANF